MIERHFLALPWKGPAACLAVLLALQTPSLAGPPYLTDDPEPTDFQHYEIYAYGTGTANRDGMASEAGIDFNYGGAPDLQLTATLPLDFDEAGQTGIGNIAIGAKYRFLHQDDFGLDVAAFPHLIFSSASADVGDKHMSLFLPVWAQKDFGDWSVFGGGGCTLNHSHESNDFCEGGMVVTHEVAKGLNLGLELFHSGAEEPGGKAATTLGAGLTYDLTETYHLLAWWGPAPQNGGEVGRYSWYSAVLFTF